MSEIRNIAIIAHVDHGKTTMVDKLLQQTGALKQKEEVKERLMDSNDLEQERGITILAKNTAITWNDYRINLVDTPGHADFGGEVERVLSMVDSVILLVDAVDGPMPQTRFVTQKAFAAGLHPIVVINKIDRDNRRPDWVINQIFDLFDSLGATEEQLDFPIIYASAIQGYARHEIDDDSKDMTPLLETIVKHTPAPNVDPEGPLQMQISSLDYSSYVGTIGIGRIHRGKIKRNMPVTIIDHHGKNRNGKVAVIYGYHGLSREEQDSAEAGDIIAIAGIEDLGISDTLCSPDTPEALPGLSVDQPTITMMFQVNTSPFAGQDGKFVTSRQIKERLERELKHNVALQVEETEDPDTFKVSGRGELHLSILLENMRREGYELAVGQPAVIFHETEGGKREEPFELLVVDVPEEHQGKVMELLGTRKAKVIDMQVDQDQRIRIEYHIPTRGLIGLRTDFLTATSGEGLMHHVFDHYGPYQGADIGQRVNGVLISNGKGKAIGYSLANLQQRGRLMIHPQTEVYEGMVVGLHSRNNDLVVNCLKGKQLTNIRASGSDENIQLTPPINLTLESALELIAEDELVEITPQFIRIRKKYLTEQDRRKYQRASQ